MFAQISLSNKYDNYTFKIKIQESDLEYLKGAVKDFHKLLENRRESLILRNIYDSQNIFNGEIIGIDYSIDESQADAIKKEFMVTELNKLKNYFISQDFKVYDIKILTLESRLKELDKQDEKINKKITESVI